MRRMAVVLALAVLLAGCGRETSVQLSGGGAGAGSQERPMTGDPHDTSGGMAAGGEEEQVEPPDPGDDGTDQATARSAEDAPRSVPPRAPAEGATTPGSQGGGSPPNRGMAVGEPNPGDPDGCPECTSSSEPVDPSATPEPRPRNPSTEPRPGTDNPHPREWESAKVHADDVTVTVTWWSGVEPCHVLDHVEVHEEADRVVITLYEGSQSGWDGACTAQAVQKQTDVKLSAPLKGRAIVDGAKK